MKTNVSTKIILDTRRSLSNGLYPVKLRVCHNRKVKYYRLSHALTKILFTSIMDPNNNGKLKKLRMKLLNSEQKAINIIDKMEGFTFKDFEDQYLDKKKDDAYVFKTITRQIERLYMQGRIKSARSYKNLNSSIKAYHGKDTLTFDKITVKFLEDYERWMLQSGKSITTVGIYIRNMRTLFNKAIEEGVISRDLYPFGRNKYQIPTGKNVKKALTKDEVRKIIDYKPSSDREAYCRDLWLFSYFANGVNITDVAHLTGENIQDNFLVFSRHKTLRTNRQNPKIIRVYINDKLQEIIESWGLTEGKDTYIFPILKRGMTADEQVDRIEGMIKSINIHMQNIATKLHISKKVTTYTARHTFSTVLKRSGASIEFISESLGHKNINTTEHYLDSFDDTEKEKWSKALI